jgi:hypothetical protein
VPFAAPAPQLRVELIDNVIRISWPASAAGFSLQSTTNLPAATNAWAAVTNVPVVTDLRYTVTNNLSGSRKYYRLLK